jgi:hypothetical protein
MDEPGHQTFHWSFRDGCKPRKRCLTEDVADQRYTAKEEKQYKSPFSFDLSFIQIYVTYHEKLCVSYISPFL